MPARNESWCIGLTASAALMWCDELVILDHASTDDTLWRIAAQIDPDWKRIALLTDDRPDWCEMAQRDRMLIAARRYSQATHIAILDADELVTGPLVSRMRGLCESLAPGWMLELPQINLRGSIDTMHGSGVWAEQHTAVVFRDAPDLHWAAAADGYQHHARSPLGVRWRGFRPVQRAQGGLFHLQMANERRLRAKQYHYELSDMLNFPTRRTPEQTRQYYSLAVYGVVPAWIPSAEESMALSRKINGLIGVPPSWWEPYRTLLPYLHLDAEPWQLEDCRRILREHPELGLGLDSFGVV